METNILGSTVSTKSEVITTVDTTEDAREVGATEADTSELETEAETQESGKPELISDKEAIELFEAGNRTSNNWREFNVSVDMRSDNYIMYQSPTMTNPGQYYALSPEKSTRLSEPDIRGNTEIYYGNHEWMEENLPLVFTESFIEKYFTYGNPSPLVYQDGTVYALPPGGAGYYSGKHANYTILERTETELAVMCEVYKYDFDILDIDYSEIGRLLYVKFVKDGDNWLIDEHYSDYPSRVSALDRIPNEYDRVYKKYYEIMPYYKVSNFFEKPEETPFDESKIIGTFTCVGKHYNGEFYKDAPEITPQLSFYKDGSCRFTVGYKGDEICIDGNYNISGRNIDIELDYTGTQFYGNTRTNLQFYFKADDLIEINSDFSDDIQAGYGFIRDDTADAPSEITQEHDNSGLISDKEAIKLFGIGEYTSNQWLRFGFGTDSNNAPIYREYTDSKLIAYYPVEKDMVVYTDPDIRGNTKIYYGNHEWMQENLRKVFTEKYIEKYFSYGYPSPLICENGIVYSMPYSSSLGSDIPSKTYKNHTIIHKTENELAVICEVYKTDYITGKYDFSKIAGLAYMKFVKINDLWLIDEHYSAGDGLVIPNDPIPSEYFDNLPEKYHSMTSYFEGYEEEIRQVDIEGFKKLPLKTNSANGKPYITKDDILKFDTNAEFRGPDSTFMHNGAELSSFRIVSTDHTLWGKDCFVRYFGRVRADSENLVGEEKGVYGTIYEYTGDGSDILFDPEMVITIPNITYNDFIYVLENISKLENVDFERFFDTDQYPFINLRDSYTDDTVLTDIGDPIKFTVGDDRIVIEVVDEDRLSDNQYTGLNLKPIPARIYNRMNIFVRVK